MSILKSPGASGGQCKVGIAASSSTSSSEDRAAVTALCIISHTPNLDDPLSSADPFPIGLAPEPARLPLPGEATAPSENNALSSVFFIVYQRE